MRLTAILFVPAIAVLLLARIASADGPYKINYNFHEPNDLKAYQPPGPSGAVDGTGNQLTASQPGRELGIEPGGPAPPSLANDPNAVRWPTLDRSEWEKTKGQYNIKPK